MEKVFKCFAILFFTVFLVTGCGNDSTPANTTNVEGTWTGEYQTNLIGSTEFTMDLVQDGNTLSGFFHSAEFEGGLSGEITQTGADLKLALDGNSRTGTINLVLQNQNSSLKIVSISGSDNLGNHENGTGICDKKPLSTDNEFTGMPGEWTGRIYLHSDNTPSTEEQSTVVNLIYKGDGIYSGQMSSDDVKGILTLRQNGNQWDVVFVETEGGVIAGTFYSPNAVITNTNSNQLEFIRINLEGTRKSTGNEKVTCLINLINYEPMTFLGGTWKSTGTNILSRPFGNYTNNGTVIDPPNGIVIDPPFYGTDNGSIILGRTGPDTYSGTYTISLLGMHNTVVVTAPIRLSYTGNMFNQNGFLANIEVVGPLVVTGGPRNISKIAITPIYIGKDPMVFMTSLTIYEENQTNTLFVEFQKQQ